MALGQPAGKELGRKTCKEPLWGLPAFTQKMHFSSGPHLSPACSQPHALPTILCWLGFLAWPQTCTLAGAGVVVTSPLAVHGNGLSPFRVHCACALGESSHVLTSLPPSAPLPACPAASPAGCSLALPVQGRSTLACFPRPIHCCKGQFCNLCTSWKGQESIKNNTSQISFSLSFFHCKFLLLLHAVVEYLHLFL